MGFEIRIDCLLNCQSSLTGRYYQPDAVEAYRMALHCVTRPFSDLGETIFERIRFLVLYL
jgi:hypothetical protein